MNYDNRSSGESQEIEDQITILYSNKNHWKDAKGFSNPVRLRVRGVNEYVNNELIDFEVLRQVTLANINSLIDKLEKELNEL